MIDEIQYAKDLQTNAKKAQKSDRAEVRQAWNPNRPWASDKYGGRVPDEKTLQCRIAIISTLRQRRPLSANQIYVHISGYGERRQRNAKDWLVTAGEIVPVKEDRKIISYTLPKESQQ